MIVYSYNGKYTKKSQYMQYFTYKLNITNNDNEIIGDINKVLLGNIFNPKL
jgi:hypothetical protein